MPSFTMTDSPSTGSADHLVVLIHGLWGNPSHLTNLASTLRKTYSEDELHILVPKSNSSNFTYDGIELGGERITHEIENKIRDLEDGGKHTIKKLSVIGYSLGGLIARYAIGLLYTNGWFDRIQPVNFTTFATPHLGVRTPSTGVSGYVWNVLGSRTLSTSGQQIFLIDSFRDSGRPLLAVMADPNSVFVRGLEMFKHRSLYANIINDRSVVFYTAAISKTDPYVDLSCVELRPLQGTDGVLLEPSDPVRHKTPAKMTTIERITSTGKATVQAIPFAIFLGVLLPFGMTAFLVNAGVQSFRSAQRVRLHETGQAGIVLDRYRMPFLLEEARHLQDRVYRNLSASDMQGEEYLPASQDGGDERAGQDAHTSRKSVASSRMREKGTDKFPILALTDDQFEMIDALDNVGFEKFHVHISKVRHTHAAIVVRSNRWGFDEGKTVLRHWVENFEL